MAETVICLFVYCGDYKASFHEANAQSALIVIIKS